MKKVNICFILLGFVQFAALAADCNNPLTSAENWDEDLLEDRPRYLSEPVALADGADLGICAGLLGDCDQTCCDANTILDIEQVVEKYLEHLEKVAERKVGPILDTIADFHPDTQEEVGYEYDMDGAQEGVVTGELTGTTKGNRGLQTQPEGPEDQGGEGRPEDQDGEGLPEDQDGEGRPEDQDGEGRPEDQDGEGRPEDEDGEEGNGNGNGNGNGHGQGHVDPTNKPKPPKKPEDLSDEELEEEYQTQQQEMGDRYRPKNRGKRRWRPGLVNLTDDQKEQVRVLVEEMTAYLKTYSAEMAGCLDSQLKQMAGLLCMGCNACYADYVAEDAVEGTATVTLSQESCDAMAENCSSYMEAVKELRTQFKEFKDSIKEIVQQAVDNGDIEEEHVHPEDLDDTVEDKPPKCEGDDCKDFYCKEVFEANGGLAPSDEMADPVESSRRMQTYSVSYNFVEGEGYNPQNVEASYSTAVDNFTAEDLSSSEEDDSAYTLALGLIGVILSLV